MTFMLTIILVKSQSNTYVKYTAIPKVKCNSKMHYNTRVHNNVKRVLRSDAVGPKNENWIFHSISNY